MIRFFIRPDQIAAGDVTFDAGDAHHLCVVLHARAGDMVAVLDGTGQECVAALTEIGKSHARGRIVQGSRPNTECRTRITVAQALPKMADKMETVLQRGTEVGAAAFWAFASERSLPHLVGERHAKRISRWEAIVKTAAEQSHRSLLPAVRADQTFADVIREAASFDLALLAYEGETALTLKKALESAKAPDTVLIVIGPEGGLTDAEASAARKHGMASVSLGPRILRTETAALLMVSQIVYALEG